MLTSGESVIEVNRSTESDIREFIAWRYDPPYDVYNMSDEASELVAYFLRPDVNCHTLHEGDVVVGFFTLGSDAHVPGGDYQTQATDVGMGIRPERTGAGEGRGFVEIVLDHVVEMLNPSLVRVTVAAGNKRALKVWKRAGFSEASRFSSGREILGSSDFAVLIWSPEDRI